MNDLALLILRLVLGGLLVGHGAQKLFGWFEGPGVAGTGGMMAALGLRPARAWAVLDGLAEFGGGLLTLLGFLNPLGPVALIGVMAMATATVHWDKPIWATQGGAELPLTNAAVALALVLTGPGRFSLDQALGVHLPGWVALLALLVVAAMIAVGLDRRGPAQTAPAAAGD